MISTSQMSPGLGRRGCIANKKKGQLINWLVPHSFWNGDGPKTYCMTGQCWRTLAAAVEASSRTLAGSRSRLPERRLAHVHAINVDAGALAAGYYNGENGERQRTPLPLSLLVHRLWLVSQQIRFSLRPTSRIVLRQLGPHQAGSGCAGLTLPRCAESSVACPNVAQLAERSTLGGRDNDIHLQKQACSARWRREIRRSMCRPAALPQDSLVPWREKGIAVPPCSRFR